MHFLSEVLIHFRLQGEMNMYYVLRTHGDIKFHWGFTAVATAKSKKEANKIARDLLANEPSRDKYVVVKALEYWQYSANVKVEYATWKIEKGKL